MTVMINKDEFSKPLCPYCSSGSSLHVSSSDIHLRTTAVDFDKFRCPECGLIFMQSIPADLGAYYPHSYRFRPNNIEELATSAELQKYKLNLLTQFKDAGDLLEIGGSNGAFCLLAKTVGFNVTAIEMDGDSICFLREKMHIDAIQSSDPSDNLSSDCRDYDVISLWHSLEHMREPWTLLKLAASRLKPGGVLVIAVPNPVALQARILKSRWLHYDIPRHLFDMPPSWMRDVLLNAGLVEKLCTFKDQGSKFYTRLSWIFYFESLAVGGWKRRLLGRIGAIVGRVLNPLECNTGNAAAYTMVFARPEIRKG